ncbi:MAG: MBL fold metallo-hydrolase [Hyphomicrobiales bacterium]|nr:MBL fold metallo-hydrolase [Hyphomicrobiales bacterium]
MKLTLLGTGSPEPYARRASPGYLIEAGTELLQFDCGGGSFDRLLQCGADLSKLSHLFLSHLHSDHMMDYARLVHARWDCHGHDTDQMKVYGPAPIGLITTRYFGPEGALAFDLTARTEDVPSQQIYAERGGELPRRWPVPEVTEISKGFELNGTGWCLRTVEVPHAQPYLKSLAFRLDCDGKSFVFSGDSGPSGALTRLAEGADLLVHMCFQLSGEAPGRKWSTGSSGHLEIAEMAAKANVRKIILSHLRPHMDAEGVHDRMIDDMAAKYGGEIVIGEDLDTFIP